MFFAYLNWTIRRRMQIISQKIPSFLFGSSTERRWRYLLEKFQLSLSCCSALSLQDSISGYIPKSVFLHITCNWKSGMVSFIIADLYILLVGYVNPYRLLNNSITFLVFLGTFRKEFLKLGLRDAALDAWISGDKFCVAKHTCWFRQNIVITSTVLTSVSE
jgi:hypothetical protein